MTKKLKTIFCFFLLDVYLFNKLSNCNNVPGLDSPVEIFQDYFQQFFENLNNKNKSSLSLVSVHEQVIDVKVYRFIFKLVNTDNKIRYIGILSVLSNEELKKPKPKHKVIRYIQSADFRDSQRLLGVYDTTKEDQINCQNNFKQDFWNIYSKNPLKIPIENQKISAQNDHQNHFELDRNLLENLIHLNPVQSNIQQDNNLVNNFLTKSQQENNTSQNIDTQLPQINQDHLLQQHNIDLLLQQFQQPIQLNQVQTNQQNNLLNENIANNSVQNFSQQQIDSLLQQLQNSDIENLLLNNQLLQQIKK